MINGFLFGGFIVWINIMPEKNEKSLHQKLEKSYFTTLKDGTVLYKPPFRKNRYIVPDVNTKNEIISELKFKRAILMLLLSLSFSIQIIARESYFNLVSSVVIGAIGLLIIMNSTRKIYSKMRLYNSNDGR